MLKQDKIDSFFERFLELVPEDLRRYRDEMGHNARAAFSAALARMDLVTREEFDIQTALLSRTRSLVDELERKVTELEQRLRGQAD
ncbi:MAG: accessory factor UbiK family protein [Gammaproteobacteria bacterium]|nr:accessory factor UbiK family protein [Gammaproteobacteria bacterium]